MGKEKAKEKPSETLLFTIMEVAQRRGFLNPSAEIYTNRLSGFYDYGPLGFLLKTNIMELWRDIFVREEIDPIIYEINGTVILPEDVLIASGHAKNFDDPIVNCKNPKCKNTVRADHLIEEKLGKSVEGMKNEELNKMVAELNIKCPLCGGDLEPIQSFNLMLSTMVGPGTNAKKAYLRPETAQTIFMNYRNVMNAMRVKLPFGIAQIGPSYRNEISPRQGLIRLREFNQMEIETFIDPEKVNELAAVEKVRDVVIRFIDQKSQIEAREKGLPAPEGYDEKVGKLLDSGKIINPYLAYYMGKEELFYRSLGVPHENIRFRHMVPEETPFYSKGNYDVEIKLSIGWKEVIGNAYRTDHDIKTHQEYSKTNLTFNQDGKKIIPHNIEPSFGVERAFYCTLENAYIPENTDRDWSWFKFPKRIAPYFVHVYPLQKKPNELISKSMELFSLLKKKKFRVSYDESASIGKRYQRADEIGTPYCITVDHSTIEEGDLKETVTIRDRDSKKQIRVKIAELVDILWKLYNDELEFEKAGPLIQ